MLRYIVVILLLCIFIAPPASAQQNRLRVEITEGVAEPMPIAIAPFIYETARENIFASELVKLITSDLESSGLFRVIPPEAYLYQLSGFDETIRFSDWRIINAQALIVGEVVLTAENRVNVRFRLFDVFASATLGDGLQIYDRTEHWRRVAHRISDEIYSRITGEDGYFNSRIVFIDEQGPKNTRKKRIAAMDHDGNNLQYLTDDSALVFSPTISKDGKTVFYTGYSGGFPQIHMLDILDNRARVLSDKISNMTFSPAPSSDGQTIVYSIENRGNTDIFSMQLPDGRPVRLTTSPAIDTAPSFSPDGQNIVFESDRSGTSQLYIIKASGGEARRISFGDGQYSAPAWSPRGDYIAFTKHYKDDFHIGIMGINGQQEQLLTTAFLDEGPAWSPNGRVLLFSRQVAGEAGESFLYKVDIFGRNVSRVPTPANASDPAWSGLLQ